MTKLFTPLLPAVAAAIILATLAVAEEPAQRKKRPVKTPDVVFLGTPEEIADKMVELAEVTPKDVVYDLGCGDGVIVVAAAKKGAQSVGFDIDPQRIREAEDRIYKNEVTRTAKAVRADMFKQDLSKASVIMLYLIPSLNKKLIPQLEQLKPGSRIVSHDANIPGLKPEKIVTVKGAKRMHTLYLWRAPLQREREDDAQQPATENGNPDSSRG
jgi:SAM-dependent methyltransferase